MCAFNTMRVGDGSALLTDKSNGAHVYILDLTAFLVRSSTCAIIELIDGVILCCLLKSSTVKLLPLLCLRSF